MHAPAATLTFISSVPVSPPHPSKCFSARNACTRRSKRSRSSALNHRAGGRSWSTIPDHESGIGPVGSRRDVTGMRRSTADTPTYPTTIRTKAAPTTASPSIRSPPRGSLVPPAVQPSRLYELSRQRLDRFRSLVHNVRTERVEASGQHFRVADRGAESTLHPIERDPGEDERVIALEGPQPGDDAVGADVVVPTVRPHESKNLIRIAPGKHRPSTDALHLTGLE